jgi:arabinofuranan 3-O-arabinosyltransferase
VTPYLFLYDVMVLAIAVGFLVRIGLSDGFRSLELPGLSVMAFLLMFYPLFGAPTGFGATLIVAALIGRRCLVPRIRVTPSVSPINLGQFQT